jgi:glycosyltransferase involved in cell wall biosynthesis
MGFLLDFAVAMPHKVLLVIPHLEQGGAERQILELMTRLPARFEPTLCVWSGADGDVHYPDYLPPGEPRHVLGIEAMGPIGLSRLVKVIRDERPTILHSYRDKANFWSRVAALAAPVPVVLTSVRNRNIGPFYSAAERLLHRRTDRVLTNSVGVKEELVSWAGVPPQKIQIINNFIDLGKFTPPTDAERAAARAAYGLGAGDVALVLPGRFAVQKHQLGLGVALRLLKKAGRLPENVKVLLAGRVVDRGYSKLVGPWMRALGLARNVRLLEPVKNVRELYAAADALVMPSLYEGLSNSILEAHACGLPAVVSHAANRDEIVVHGSTGWEAPTLDHRTLAEAIGKMIELPDAERRRMGARGRVHVEARFHPDRILEETVALYDGILAEKGLA